MNSVQEFGNTGETVRDLKSVALKKRLSSKQDGTLDSETKPYMPKEAAISAHSFPALPAWLKM